jgi:hypothetical protein
MGIFANCKDESLSVDLLKDLVKQLKSFSLLNNFGEKKILIKLLQNNLEVKTKSFGFQYFIQAVEILVAEDMTKGLSLSKLPTTEINCISDAYKLIFLVFNLSRRNSKLIPLSMSILRTTISSLVDQTKFDEANRLFETMVSI